MMATQPVDSAASEELKDLYRQLILDHARKPRNFQRLDDATHRAEGINPLCGDKVQLYLIIDSQDRICSVGFEGSGCAISIASASLMTETLKDLPVDVAKEYFAAVTQRLTSDMDEQSEVSPAHTLSLKKLHALDGVRQYPSRVKCATLPWHALRAALSASPTSATTE